MVVESEGAGPVLPLTTQRAIRQGHAALRGLFARIEACFTDGKVEIVLETPRRKRSAASAMKNVERSVEETPSFVDDDDDDDKAVVEVVPYLGEDWND